ncbi:MAG: cell division protein FtsQ/DivIB [SAR324 cluster bacterium]|nr:cell division protein FtsQ/DivIB [SAR324 cluster bacterium]
MQDFKNHASKRQTTLQQRQKKYDIRYSKRKLTVSPQGKPNFHPAQTALLKPGSSISRLKNISLNPSFLLASWNRILIGLGLLVFLLWILTGIIFLGISYTKKPLRQFDINGYSLLTPSSIYQMTAIAPDTRFGDIDAYSVSEILNQHPMIEQVQTRKLLPGYMSIALKERRPYAHVQILDSYYLIDRQFHPLQKIPDFAAKEHLVLTGIQSKPVSLGQPILSPALRKGLNLLDLLNEMQIDWKDIAELDLADPLNYKLKLRSPPSVVQLGQDRLPEKLNTFKRIYSQLIQNKSSIRSIDLRYKNKAIVQ